MISEKQVILTKIDTLLHKRTAEMLNELPDVHEVDDGIIVRFFGKWDNCENNDDIKYKKINNIDNTEESVIFYYLPKGSIFEIKDHFFIGCVTCLNGAIDLKIDNKYRLLENYSKIEINSDNIIGNVYENTYLVITTDYKDWSEINKRNRATA